MKLKAKEGVVGMVVVGVGVVGMVVVCGGKSGACRGDGSQIE